MKTGGPPADIPGFDRSSLGEGEVGPEGGERIYKRRENLPSLRASDPASSSSPHQ